MWSISQIEATWIIRIGRQVKVIQKAVMIIRRTPETHVSLRPALWLGFSVIMSQKPGVAWTFNLPLRSEFPPA